MAKLNSEEVAHFVNNEIVAFHHKKLKKIESLELTQVLKKKNPYLFRAKNLLVASDLIRDIMDAFLYASEEKFFGDLLENLAIFIADEVYDGRKSAASGIDLEFDKENTRYLVSVKSGPNWGNNSQQVKQRQDFNRAITVLKQSNRNMNIQPVLGICYGKSKDSNRHGILKTMGQRFWYLISNNEELYTDIIEPLGHEAKKHNDKFKEQKANLINKFTSDFTIKFCAADGSINWKKLVEFNSGNLAD